MKKLNHNLATEKQKLKMRKLGIEFDQDMTREEAEFLLREDHLMREDMADRDYSADVDFDDVPLFDRSTSSIWNRDDY